MLSGAGRFIGLLHQVKPFVDMRAELPFRLRCEIDAERFAIMLDTAKQLSEGLDTYLLDDQRQRSGLLGVVLIGGSPTANERQQDQGFKYLSSHSKLLRKQSA